MRKRDGFTLVEIMIVVAVLGILASIAFSNIQSYRDKAQKNVCIANLKDIDSYISLWAINNGKTGSDTIEMSDLVPLYIRSTPYCPQDTAKTGYVLATVSEKPACPANPGEHYIN